MPPASRTAAIIAAVAIAAAALSPLSVAASCGTRSREHTWCTLDRLGNESRVNDATDHGQHRPDVAGLLNSATKDYVVVWQSDRQDGDAEGIYAKIVDGGTGAVKVAEFLVNAGLTALGQSRPAVAATSDGGFVVVFQSAHAANTSRAEGIYAKTYAATGSPRVASALQVNEHTANGQRNPAVAGRLAGGFVVAWDSEFQDGSLEGVFARVFPAMTSTAGASAEFRVNEHRNGAQRHPSLASLPETGGFVVVWESQGQAVSGVGSAIFARTYDSSGAAATSEFQVSRSSSSTSSESAANPHVAAVGNDFVVVWSLTASSASSGEHVYGRQFRSTGVVVNTTANFPVATTRTGSQRFPKVAGGLADHGFVVVWQSEHEGFDEGVFVQPFTTWWGLIPVGPERQANVVTLHGQTRPVIAVLDTAHMVAVWESNNQDGSGKGVYSLRLRFGRGTKPATCAPSIIEYYDAEPPQCGPLDSCRSAMCRCMLGTAATAGRRNGTDFLCLANTTSSMLNLPGVACATQSQCFVAYRQCVEVAAYLTGLPTTAGISTDCRTWGRMLRESTRQSSTGAVGWYERSMLRQSCAATACAMYRSAPTKCSFMDDGGADDTAQSVCVAPLPIDEISAAAVTTSAAGASPGTGSGPSAGSPGAGGSTTAPAAPSATSAAAARTTPASTMVAIGVGVLATTVVVAAW